MRSLKTIVAVALLVLMVSSLAGCSCVAQKAAESATGVKVNQNGKSVTITGKNGTASISGTEGKLPQDLPSDVPVYAGTVKSSATVSTGQGTNYTFTVETSDDVATVQGWYKDKLTSNGWTVTGAVTGGSDSAMVSAKQGETKNIVVTVGKNSSDGKTAITAIVAVKK